MNLDDLKDRIIEWFTATWGEIQESSLYNNVREKYETLNPSAQKAINVGGVVFFLLLIFSIPLMFFSSSQEYVERFENDRQLIRELLKTRLQPSLGYLRKGSIQNADQLKARVDGRVRNVRLLPEQVVSIENFNVAADAQQLAPEEILQFGVEVKLKQLNLKEVRSIGYELQAIADTIKLIGVNIQVNAEKDHYFDVIYKLISFALPEEEKEVKKSDAKKNSRKSRRRRKGN